MKKALLLTLLLGMFATLGFSQKGTWTAHIADGNKIVTDKAVARQTFPKSFKLFDLNIAPLRQQLFSIVGQNALAHSTIITLPNVDGGFEQFEVFEASNFDATLQARFPEIRAYSGKGITDKGAVLKLSISAKGIQTMIFRNEKENEFIEAYSQDHSVYAVFRSYRTIGGLPWTCSTPDANLATSLNKQVQQAGSNFTSSSAGELKTMRLAQSCNGEYSNYFGAFDNSQVALVMAAFNATLTRCNGVYEKDLALHLNLIANTTDVIYYDPGSDPYSNNLNNWNAQLQNTLTAIIGDANYDIGHMFGATGGGGNAGCIGCVCGSGKGSGITSPADGIPEGDNFDIDYVVHEVGHQLGANHTFSMSNEGTGVNMEVGSGITIMGYAGITNQDVAPHSIDIYHEASIEQIQDNLAGKTCPVTTPITANNATPVVAAVANRIIPISTPFALTGSATDANAGDVLTYCWEQNDNSTTTGNNSVAFPTKTTGPNYLSFSPTTNPTRLLPKLSTILAGLSVTPVIPGGDAIANIEALSSVARTLNFRLTVRDNSAYSSTAPIKVGQTAFTDMAVTVSAAVGPFLITTQNAAVSYAGGSAQTVTWSVNGTTGAPTNTANVKISWSSDGGQTFPTVLAASTANDGTESITIPAGATTTGRIKVEAIGNIYFDINNANITVTAPVNDFIFGTPVVTPAACPATTATASISTTTTGTFVTPIVLTATAGVPAGTTVTFAPNPLTPGAAVVATLNNAGALVAGTYAVTVTGTAGATIHTTVVNFVISAGTAPTLSAPANQIVCVGATATFSVTSTGTPTGYQWQVSTDGGTTWSNIAGATAASYTSPAVTAGMNGYMIRVIVTTQCSSATSSSATLTVRSAPSITAQPQSATVCAGTNAVFNVTGAGAGLTYQWQLSTDAGVTWNNIGAATAASYTVTGVTNGQNGYRYRVIISGTCTPAVTSAAATLTVGDAAAIGTQPSSQTVCVGSPATFTVAATGSNLTYQWQVSTVAVPAFTDIAGATSASYTITSPTAAQSGNQYRVTVFSCTPTGITSSVATLTVNTPVAIGTQPAATAQCIGSAATFSVAATGTTLSYQWQYAATCAGTFANIAGATSATYTMPAVTLANGGAYRVIVTGACGPVTSSCVLLTVNSPLVITTQPTDVTVCLPLTGTISGSFTVAATGTAPTYQWQISTDGGTTFTNITGATSATYTIASLTAAMTGNKFRAVLNGTCTAALNSAVATLVVNTPVNITAQPTSKVVCSTDPISFSVTATGSTISYQWQVSYNNGPFINLTNATPYSGATTNTLTITNIGTSLSGNRYRVIVSGVPCGDVPSSIVNLTVNQAPTVELALRSYANVNPYVRTGLFPVVSPTGSYSFAWYKNGALLNGVNATSLPLGVDDFGTYTVVATNTVTGCSDESSAVTLADSASNILFVYPNPSMGKFEVRYYNQGGAAHTRTLSIYDAKGAKVFKQQFALTGVYAKMPVDMSGAGSGVYYIDLSDASGKRIASGRVVIRR